MKFKWITAFILASIAAAASADTSATYYTCKIPHDSFEVTLTYNPGGRFIHIFGGEREGLMEADDLKAQPMIKYDFYNGTLDAYSVEVSSSVLKGADTVTLKIPSGELEGKYSCTKN